MSEDLMFAPVLRTAVVALVAGLFFACPADQTDRPSTPDLRAPSPLSPEGVSVVAKDEPRAETHARRRFTVRVELPEGPRVLTDEAIEVATAGKGRVAWVDARGLHLHRDGRERFVGAVPQLGLAASEAGVLHATAAERGEGTGLGLTDWNGTTRVLLPAIEELPGPSGYFHPIFSPDLQFAFVRSSLTPRPSVVRVEVKTGASTTLAKDVPSAASEWTFVDGQLAWTSGEGDRVRLHPSTGAVEVLP